MENMNNANNACANKVTCQTDTSLQHTSHMSLILMTHDT